MPLGMTLRLPMRAQRRDVSIPSSRRTPEPLAARVFLCVALAPPRCETNACGARHACGTAAYAQSSAGTIGMGAPLWKSNKINENQ